MECAWIGYSKEECVYDKNNNKISELSYEWDNEKQTWIEDRKSVNSYNEYGYILSSIKYRWNAGISDWEKERITKYVYRNK
ncbi:MAG: hypothetical protein E7069_12185 [Bacteroidales bacterium]|jgi:hypothetical protein|nr:hypothetical protein [Bacteroidales bacterium]